MYSNLASVPTQSARSNTRNDQVQHIVNNKRLNSNGTQMALNLTRSANNSNTNPNGTNNQNSLNESSKQQHNQAIGPTLLSSGQLTAALIDPFAQTLPNATSTPNPIQQQNISQLPLQLQNQQQHQQSNQRFAPNQVQMQHHQQQHQHQHQQPQQLNQDIFTNLLLKFDPTNFFTNKDQISLLFNNNQGSQPSANLVVTNQNAANLNDFNNLINSAAQINRKSTQSNINVSGNNNQQQHQFLNHQLQQQQQQQQQFFNPNMAFQQQFQMQQHQQQQQYQPQQILNNQQQHPQQMMFNQSGISQQNNNRTNNKQKSSINNSNTNGLNDSSGSENDAEHSANSGEKPYKCSQCFKTFRKKVHLNQHCRIHSGERPYGCEFCEKRFTQLSHLWQHTRRHTGERPYKCDVGTCEKSFTQLSNLQSHLKTHGNQASQSAYNDMANLSDLNQHVNINTNSNNQLKKAFNNREELVVNVVTKNEKNNNNTNNANNTSKTPSNNKKNKRHYCELCTKRFATEGVIRSHACSKQPNTSLVRNSEGSLVLKNILEMNPNNFNTLNASTSLKS
jgi:hypothetical protein